MRRHVFGCGAILTLLASAACSTGIEEVRGSLAGVDARVSGMRTGTRLMLVGERNGPLSEESVAGDWVQFRVPNGNRAVADAPDQCLSILQSDGTPVSAGKFPLTFRHDLWIRASRLQDQEAQLRQSMMEVQNEIARLEAERDKAVRWLNGNPDIRPNGRCSRPATSEQPAISCAPQNAAERATQFCRDAVVDCAVIGLTMGKLGETMFDSSFIGNKASEACGQQTATVVGDEYGITGLLAAATKDPNVQAAAESLALDSKNPQKMEAYVQAVLAHPAFASCVPIAETTCQTNFSKWQAATGKRLAQCRSATRTADKAREKIEELTKRREELERQLAPIRQELGTLRTSGSVALRQGC